jgi:hypothetical protein
VATASLAVACYAVFGVRHGFEESIGWYLCLLPGSFVAGGISDKLSKTSEKAAYLAFWGTLLALTFLWYFAISFAVIKIYRLICRAFGRL